MNQQGYRKGYFTGLFFGAFASVYLVPKLREATPALMRLAAQFGLLPRGIGMMGTVENVPHALRVRDVKRRFQVVEATSAEELNSKLEAIYQQSDRKPGEDDRVLGTHVEIETRGDLKFLKGGRLALAVEIITYTHGADEETNGAGQAKPGCHAAAAQPV